MKPADTGHLYDKIASRWDAEIGASTTGLLFVERAIRLAPSGGKALDVGCGSGGRIITALVAAGFQVVGLDISAAMIEMAKTRHPDLNFICDDICEWRPPEQYNVIIAWDSIFHVPHASQSSVIRKLCGALAHSGVILFTAAGIDAEILGEMYDERFYYSSLAAMDYLRLLAEMECRCVLLDRDQYPEEHVVYIGVKS
jgi:2-polyprenyl-3-methyl-5-hydroxy-6-metoxy-1,4-benzoquinol methylase